MYIYTYNIQVDKVNKYEVDILSISSSATGQVASSWRRRFDPQLWVRLQRFFFSGGVVEKSMN